MSLTPVSSSYEDIWGVPSMHHVILPEWAMWICMEERSPLWVRRSKSEETLCRLLITMAEETFDIRRSWVDHGRPVMNLEERICWGREFQMAGEAKEMICGPFWSDIRHNKKILVGRSKRSWRNVWCNQISIAQSKIILYRTLQCLVLPKLIETTTTTTTLATGTDEDFWMKISRRF